MTDRELLEAAARAAGLDVWPGIGFQDGKLFVAARPDPSGKVTGIAWDPLNNDDVALRLAVELHLIVCSHRGESWAQRLDITIKVPHNGDPYAATRRAIVRAAAALGDKNGTA